MTFEELVLEVQAWQRKTFPRETPMGITKQFITEALELYTVVDNECPIENIEEEIADCMLLLIGLAGKLSIDKLHIDIMKSLEKKHVINTKRDWGKMNDQGFVEHV